jgi:transcriptional regulator
MYDLPEFKEPDAAVITQFMHDNPFIFLAGSDENNQPVATQVPVFVDERDGVLFLTGHIMKNTDHHKAFRNNSKVLAVFTAPAHTYVSASWYEDKRQGSTWNYMTVQAKGELKFLDEQSLLGILQRTTDFFENNPSSGSNFKDLPEEYVQRLVKAIVAIEIEVKDIRHVFKLSQNRDAKSYRNIISKLDEKDAGAQYIAAEMKKRLDANS